MNIFKQIFQEFYNSRNGGSMDPNCMWWEPPKESLPIEFCEDTALHGLKYVGQPKRSIFERVFWLLAFITGVVVACFLISGVWRKYNSSPVVITFEDKAATISQIPFPAVTLCNVNNIHREKALEIIRKGYNGTIEDLEKVSLLHHICSANIVRFSQKFGYHANGTLVPEELLTKIKELEIDREIEKNGTKIMEFLELNAQSCKEMILLCRWDDKIHDCSELFHSVATDFGKCCTFNMVPRNLLQIYSTELFDDEPNFEQWAESKLSTDEMWEFGSRDNSEDDPHVNGHIFPRRLKSAGQTNGLSILVNPGRNEYFCSTADFLGLEILAHLSITTPHIVDLGSAIEPNSEIFVNISPDIINAESSIYEFDVNKRNCYFDGELNLKYYKYYTLSNCIDECITNMTYQKCNCVRYYMPREPHQNICGLQSECAEMIEDSFTEQYLKGNCGRCLPTCNDVRYATEIHGGPLRNDAEIWTKNGTSKENWSDLQVSIVHVFFGESNVFPKIRKQLFGITDLIASTGGLLGLCLGFSALSFLEVIYFLTIRLFFSILRKRRFVANVESLSTNSSSSSELESVSIIKNKIFPDSAIITPSSKCILPSMIISGHIKPSLTFEEFIQKNQNHEELKLYRKEPNSIFYSELLVRGMMSPYQYRP